MGIFDKIKNAIWGKEEAASPKDTATVNPASPPIAASTTASAPKSAPSNAAPVQPSGSTAAPKTAASAPVDVAAILDAAVKANGQKLDWRNSIVDLMKALNLDSSLSARKELAGELNYSGDTNDSASMNIWLHKAVMQKLAQNGGKVPSELTA